MSGQRAQIPSLIVHVDDEPGLLVLIRLVLERLGHYRVESFSHSSAALEFAYDNHPALFITDMVRPNDMDGMSLCRHIRQQPALHDIPLLIHSASTHVQREAHLVNACFLAKPASLTELAQTVEKLVCSRNVR